MSKTKKKVQCPTCTNKLGITELVETRANNVHTYHCPACKWYWHVDWFKQKSGSGKSWSWAYKYIYDDFGKRFELLPRV